MIYVFDSSPFITLFRHYYPERFPTLWKKFERLVKGRNITSTREVYNEIERFGGEDRLAQWAKNNRSLFTEPVREELLFIADIFGVNHFQAMIRKKERLQGWPVADPFVVAKAKVARGRVVTQERYKKNSPNLPNVCEYFKIPWLDLEEFMKKENWRF